VQKQDVARRQIIGEASEYGVGITGASVVTTTGPARQTYTELVEHRIEKGVAKTGKGTKEPWPLACYGVQQVCAVPTSFFQPRKPSRE